MNLLLYTVQETVWTAWTNNEGKLFTSKEGLKADAYYLNLFLWNSNQYKLQHIPELYISKFRTDLK